MLILPDPGPQAQARAAQNRAQFPQAGDGVSLPPVVPTRWNSSRPGSTST